MCHQRGKTLDHVYMQAGIQSSHIWASMILIQAYIPVRRKTSPYTKTVKIWAEPVLAQLQDCFQHTEWDLFSQNDLDHHTETVLDYITYWISNITLEKQVRSFPNQKPWMTNEVKRLLRRHNTAFRCGDKDLYSSARSDLRSIKKAKEGYKNTVEDHLVNKDLRRMWQGIKQLTNHCTKATLSTVPTMLTWLVDLMECQAGSCAPVLTSWQGFSLGSLSPPCYRPLYHPA